jgi:hypothetical protein
MTDAPCPCLDHGPQVPDIADERDIGTDATDGRHADVTVLQCARCDQLWLRYLREEEFRTAASRWALVPIDAAVAATITVADAAAFIAAAPWRLVGGSYSGGVVKRIDQPGSPARH